MPSYKIKSTLLRIPGCYLSAEEWYGYELPGSGQHHYETTVVMALDYQPRIRKCYVDGTFVIWPHGRDHYKNFYIT